MAKLPLSLVFLILCTSRASSATCNNALLSVDTLCPSAAFGSQGGRPDLKMLCDNSTCNSALLAANTSCAADPRGSTYSSLLSMCQPCPRAVMQVDSAGGCVNQNGPDPAQVCNATCQPHFCNAVARCTNGTAWGGQTAQQVSQQMAAVRSLLSSCPCSVATSTSTSAPTMPATTTTTTQRENCTTPFKACGAWGDPHFTSSFYGGRFDFMGMGLFTLATSTDNSFELQGFQCRFGGSRAAVFAGFAVKVGGSSVTIVDNNVSVDGTLLTGGSHPLGLSVVGSPAHTISLDSHDNCVHFETKRAQLNAISPGFYHNMNVNIAGSIAALEGVCGSSSGRQAVSRRDALFSPSELDSLCLMCGMSNCIRRLGGRRLDMSAPGDFIPANNAIDACKTANMSFEFAASKCQPLFDDKVFWEACIYDFCSSDGDDSLVANAVESKQREVARAKRFSPSVTTTAPTTTTMHEGAALSFAPRAVPLCIWAVAGCIMLTIKRAW